MRNGTAHINVVGRGRSPIPAAASITSKILRKSRGTVTKICCIPAIFGQTRRNSVGGIAFLPKMRYNAFRILIFAGHRHPFLRQSPPNSGRKE